MGSYPYREDPSPPVVKLVEREYGDEKAFAYSSNMGDESTDVVVSQKDAG